MQMEIIMNRLRLIQLLNLIALTCCLSKASYGVSHELSIIPLPRQVELHEGVFVLNEQTQIELLGVKDRERAVFLEETIRSELYGLAGAQLRLSEGQVALGSIRLEQDESLSGAGTEGYELVVTPGLVSIGAASDIGLFWAVQTLRQMVSVSESGEGTIACCRIEDAPQSAWRGYMIDVSRRFIPVGELKAQIDILAKYKINILQLHLTDDQGWRLQIDAYPRLTTVGAWRKDRAGEFVGGFYTKQQMRELVDYAAERFVTIVPEIDIPGHSQAALAAYPEYSCTGGPFSVRTTLTDPGDVVFCAGNEATYTFLERVLDEVLEVFPSEYIHLGVDEVVVRRWETCERCQRKLRTEGLAYTENLQGYFAQRMANYLAAKGRKMICWDDLLEDQAPEGATIMFWRTWTGTQRLRAAAKQGHDIILAPVSHYYFSGSPHIQYVYNYSKEKLEFDSVSNERIIGYQGAIWTEHISSREATEAFTYPRLFAFAEGAWTSKAQRSWTDFERRLWHHYSLADLEGLNYVMPSSGGYSDRTLFQNEAEVIVDAPEQAIVHYTLNGENPSPLSEIYREPITLSADAVFKAQIFMPSGRVGPVRTGTFEQAKKLEPIELEQPIGGVRYAYKEGEMFPEIVLAKMPTARVGVIDRLRIPDDVRKDHFALEYEAYLRIQKTANYTFHTISDDGSRLWLGGQLIVDNWGFRPSISRSGSVFLEAGYYPIRVEYTEATGDALLRVSYAEEGLDAVEISAQDLFFPFADEREMIQTTMGQHDVHSIEGILDDSEKSFYWSNRAPSRGDFIQVNFDAPIDITSIGIQTGSADGQDRLRSGVLEVSSCGVDFIELRHFTNGSVSVKTNQSDVTTVRVRVLESQRDWLQIHKFKINESNYTNTK